MDLEPRRPVARPVEHGPATPSGPIEPFFLLPRDEQIENIARDEPDYDWPKNERLFNVAAVRFSKSGRIEEFDSGAASFNENDNVIVETDKGLQLGQVVISSSRAMRATETLPRVIRTTTQNDERQRSRNTEREDEAERMCREAIRARRLPMKLISAEYLHGGHRAVFYFSAEGRVDFRELAH